MAKYDYTCEFSMLHVKLEWTPAATYRALLNITWTLHFVKKKYMDTSVQHVTVNLSSICFLRYQRTS